MTPVFYTILIITIVISVSLTFLIIRHSLREKKAEKLLADFYEVVAEFKFHLSKHEVLGNRIIGLDDVNNKLLFFTRTSNKSEGFLIDLAEVKSRAVEREYGLINSYTKYWTNIEPIVRKIVMRLEYKSDANPLALTFYDKSNDSFSEMPERVVKAIEWQSLLSKRLRSVEHEAESALLTI
jgi:hypothetical protein